MSQLWKYLKDRSTAAKCVKIKGKGHLNGYKPGDLVWYLHENRKNGVACKLQKKDMTFHTLNEG